ncbi:MAG: hypothetical protein U5N27_00930 [Rhizobium sp.]|nr:hypothetical protein [Rhizobium sp.]
MSSRRSMRRMLSGRILWSHAAIHGYRDFDPRERTELEAEVGRRLTGVSVAEDGERDERPASRH